MDLGDTVNIIRKITNEPTPLVLDEALVRQAKPTFVAYWKTQRHKYKLDIEKNEVLAIDATQHHRNEMRRWYTIDDADRQALTELFWKLKKGGKSNARPGSTH